MATATVDELGYSAVSTTGIYCRPGCSARPHAEHVTPYRFAAAAEADGYRACHQCRPYRTSEPREWMEAPELVCRAVQLVLDGALDHGTEADLGQRLGISSRHLRRLFVAHVGATPDQVARSRRAHFARRLLDDTDLSITDIAFAAGFGSVRQMNRTMRDVFRAAPRDLRARRRRQDRLAADGGLVVRLPYQPPLDWDGLLGFFSARAIPGVESANDGTYRRTIAVGGDPGVIEVRPGEDGHLELVAHLPHWEALIHHVQRVRRIFDLDTDPGPVFQALAPDLGEAVRPGTRRPGAWDPFEVGVRAILGQQVSVAGATTLAGRLVERTGTAVPGLDAMGLTHLFPTPAVLAQSNLDGLGITAPRLAAIRAFAAAVDGGTLRLDRSLGLDDLVGSLVALPGVGEWTAHYVALRLGEPDAFPASDLGLRKAAGTATALPSGGELAARAEAWRPWRAYAAVNLWSAAAPRI